MRKFEVPEKNYKFSQMNHDESDNRLRIERITLLLDSLLYLIICLFIFGFFFDFIRNVTYPNFKANLTNSFLLLSIMWLDPGFVNKDSEAPPTIKTAAFPVASPASRLCILFSVEEHTPTIATRLYFLKILISRCCFGSR